MQYTQISVILPQFNEDILCAFFLQVFESSSVVEDPSLLPSDYDTVDSREMNPLPQGKVKVTCAVEYFNESMKNTLIEFLTELTCEFEINTEILKDEDWQEEWKKHYTGIHIPGYVRIVPPWLDNEPSEEKKIVINPGNGFGTGTHPTTWMCLQEMSKIDIKGKRILDVGTGSGIIGLCAAVQGAGEVLMLEKFDDAIDNARDNISRNSVQKGLNIIKFDVEDSAIPEIYQYDFIFANIILNVLKSFISLNSDKFKKSTPIFITGVLRKQDEEFSRFIIHSGLKIVSKSFSGEWCLYKTERQQG